MRGTVVFFTGLFSALFLKRRLWPFHWCALFSVCVGAAVVGYASLLVAPAEAGGASPADGEHGLWQRLRGDALVVVSQLFVATQMCIEERFVTGHDMPALLTVGCEGLWGLFGLFVLLAVLQAPSSPSTPRTQTLWTALRPAASSGHLATPVPPPAPITHRRCPSLTPPL